MIRLYILFVLIALSCANNNGHESCNSYQCPAQYELSDSNDLNHVKGLFYRNDAGHLYERTIRLKEAGWNSVFEEYFNGFLDQHVDPITFEVLDGWYAKDKNAVYYYRPVSSGMLLSKMDSVDVRTFKTFKGHYKYAQDTNHFYDNSIIIEGFHPTETNIETDKNEKAVRLVSKKKIFVFDKD